MAEYILSIDQGTTTTRAMVFDHAGRIISSGYVEHHQYQPRAGWVEHDPLEIWDNTRDAVGLALARANITRHEVAAVGITNQRETTIIWDRHTGEPVHNAIVWLDTRTGPIAERFAADGGVDRFRDTVGLPINTYFSGTKIAWILENVPGVRARAEAGDLLFGTPDTWVTWNLTGGVNGGLHITDVTNASRTLFMNLRTLDWDDSILATFGVPRSMMPTIRSSSEVYGKASSESLLRETPVAGILGDQQAATFGQVAFNPGEAKSTYGTGGFLLFNTGSDIVVSKNGLLTTVAYQLGDSAPVYALEGSIAVTGALVQWMRDNLGFFKRTGDIEDLAASVPDNGGAYIVPAFSGMFAPYWRQDARGVFTGLTRYVTKAHLARAALEATAYQARDVFDAVGADAGVPLTELKVDGGMVANKLLMQFQADMLGVPVIRPVVPETTSLGAAYAAGLAVGYWSGLDELRANWAEDRRWNPEMSPSQRDHLYAGWKKAVTKSFAWTEDEPVEAGSGF
ncbi:MAG: glycerol kinase GlpK [Bifidobacteriaceae bacterium]|jgi:glycerol kinase|nr:glycerol kinase GlpK [Bifidobacteriaceae bacterium]